MLVSLSANLEEEAEGNHSLIAPNQHSLSSVLVFLATMRDIHIVSISPAHLPRIILIPALAQSFAPGTPQSASYTAFCKDAFQLLSRYPQVFNHPRLTSSESMTWFRTVSGQPDEGMAR